MMCVCLSQDVSEVAGFGGVRGGPQARTGQKSTTKIDYFNGVEDSQLMFLHEHKTSLGTMANISPPSAERTTSHSTP